MKTQKCFLILFLLALFGGGVLTLLHCGDAPSWSVYENRFLSEAPALSVQSICSGEAAVSLEDYLRDHVPQRERLLKLATRLSLLRAKPVVNDVVSTETALLPEPLQKTADPEELAQTAAALAARYAAVQQTVTAYGGTFLYVHIPEQRDALRASYPAYLPSDGAALDASSAALMSALRDAGVSVLDLTQVLCADAASNYFATDHHFNLRGADLACQTICVQPEVQKWGVNYTKNTLFEAKNPFMGTYGRELFGQSSVTESLLFYTPTVAYTRFDNGERSETPVIQLPESVSQTVDYTAYMGGDLAETILQTQRPELPDLLIIGDSFTNPVEALLYQSFDETRSLDFRHYAEMTCTEYLRQYQPEVVLVLRDSVSCMNLTGNGALE